MREEWRDVVGYEGLYKVSSLGRVKTLRTHKRDKNGVDYKLSKVYLTPSLDAYGYPIVNLTSEDGITITRKIHRLMAMAFIQNPEGKRCVDHINGIRADNRLENLRWATHKENSDNKFRLGNQVDWKDRDISEASMYKFTHSQCRAVIRNDGERYESIAAASRALGLKSSGMVSSCVRGLREKVRGYSFRYEDEISQKGMEG